MPLFTHSNAFDDSTRFKTESLSLSKRDALTRSGKPEENALSLLSRFQSLEQMLWSLEPGAQPVSLSVKAKQFGFFSINRCIDLFRWGQLLSTWEPNTLESRIAKHRKKPMLFIL